MSQTIAQLRFQQTRHELRAEQFREALGAAPVYRRAALLRSAAYEDLKARTIAAMITERVAS